MMSNEALERQLLVSANNIDILWERVTVLEEQFQKRRHLMDPNDIRKIEGLQPKTVTVDEYMHGDIREDVDGYQFTKRENMFGLKWGTLTLIDLLHRGDVDSIWYTSWLTSLVQMKRLAIAFTRRVVIQLGIGRHEMVFPIEYRDWLDNGDFFTAYNGPMPDRKRDLDGRHSLVILYLNHMLAVLGSSADPYNMGGNKAYHKLLTNIIEIEPLGEHTKAELVQVAIWVLTQNTWNPDAYPEPYSNEKPETEKGDSR